MGLLATVKGLGVAAKVFAVVNAPGLLVAGAILGVGATVYSAWKAGNKANTIIREETRKKGTQLTFGEKAKATWKLWVPVTLEAGLTCLSMGLSYYIHYKRLAQMTQAANLLLATNQELQSKLNYIQETVPEAKEAANKYDAMVACSATTINAESDVGGKDLFYDPFFKLKWWTDYSFMVEAIADLKESFFYSGYVDCKEMYDRFRVRIKDRAKVISMAAWKDDGSLKSNKVPRINIKCQPLLDDDGFPVKGQTMYVLEYLPQDLSMTWEMYECNRPFGIDGPSWEDGDMCEDEYDEIARQATLRPTM